MPFIVPILFAYQIHVTIIGKTDVMELFALKEPGRAFIYRSLIFVVVLFAIVGLAAFASLALGTSRD